MKAMVIVLIVLLQCISIYSQKEYPLRTIKEIQTVSDSLIQLGKDGSKYAGDTVRVTGVVMVRSVIDPKANWAPLLWSGARFQSYICDTASNGEWCGINILVNDTTFPNIATMISLIDTGQVITVTGVVTEYLNRYTQIILLPNIPIKFEGKTNNKRIPTQAKISDFATRTLPNPFGEKYEGVYVEIKNVVSADRNTGMVANPFSIIDQLGNKIIVHGQSSFFTKRTYKAREWNPPIDGTEISSLKGFIGQNSDGSFVIRPAIPDDLILSSETPIDQSISISNSHGIPGDSVTVSINAVNLNNIAALTLRIKYDNTKIRFGRVLNWDTQLSGAMYGDNNGVITLAWDGISGFSIANGKLADLKFYLIGSDFPVPITFITTQCELTGTDGLPIKINLSDGSIDFIGYTVTGQVTYANSLQNPLPNVQVYINNASSGSLTSTNSSGSFTFNGKQNGTYYFNSNCSNSWGGSNSTDALFLRQYITGQRSFDSLQLKAADVNLSGTVNSTDALLIRQRTVGIINRFPAGDWVFENPSIVINGQNANINFRGLCAGDLNGSYTTPILKSKIPIRILKNGQIKRPVDNIVEIPITVNQEIRIKAITLFMNYPFSQYEIVDIKSRLEQMAYNIVGGKVKLAWDDLIPKYYNKGDTLLLIKFRIKNQSDIRNYFELGIDSESEFADEKWDLLKNIELHYPEIVSNKDFDYCLEQNYPNPFNPETTIKFSLPVKSEVSLTLFNLLGETVQTVLSGIKEGGVHEVKIRCNNLTSGIYYYRLTAKSVETGLEFTSTKKLIVLK